MRAEGWYLDPFEVHTDRWFSDGRPTDLVRDDGVESRDPPPSETFSGPLAEAAQAAPQDGSDLKRADDSAAGQPFSSRRAMAAAIETVAIQAAIDPEAP